MTIKRIIRIFKNGNVCVTGLRGRGKDVLFGNVIARRNESYISNLNYTQDTRYHTLDFDKINLGNNTYEELIKGNITKYNFPYPLGADIYISDVGIYLPSQYCNQLNRDYKNLPTYFALCRQVSHNNVHINVQNLNRAWDKIREQSDIYIQCDWCKVIFGIVIQKITLYDKYDSCLARVKPCRIKIPLFMKKELKEQRLLYIDKWKETHGNVKSRILIYKNKSKHDTYYFEKLFGNH